MEILSVGAELSHVDEQTDMTKLIVTYCNFANVRAAIFQSSEM
jgi:hypothetical protein